MFISVTVRGHCKLILREIKHSGIHEAILNSLFAFRAQPGARSLRGGTRHVVFTRTGFDLLKGLQGG
jgi:hypothetical protein